MEAKARLCDDEVACVRDGVAAILSWQASIEPLSGAQRVAAFHFFGPDHLAEHFSSKWGGDVGALFARCDPYCAMSLAEHIAHEGSVARHAVLEAFRLFRWVLGSMGVWELEQAAEDEASRKRLCALRTACVDPTHGHVHAAAFVAGLEVRDLEPLWKAASAMWPAGDGREY